MPDKPATIEIRLNHRQVRAARAWLGWSQKDLGLVAGLSARSINEIEHNRRVVRDGTVRKLLAAFKTVGIELSENGSGLSGPTGPDPTPPPEGSLTS